MDAFAVSIATGLSIACLTPRHVFRIAFHFGLFQALMPVIGWWVASSVSAYVTAVGHWLAFGLLCLIGGKMLLNAYRKARSKAGEEIRSDPTRGWVLLGLSIATSIDALAVGVSMAFLEVAILFPCIVIGVVAALFSTVGITFANRVLRRWSRYAEVVGGCVLIFIGVRIVIVNG